MQIFLLFKTYDAKSFWVNSLENYVAINNSFGERSESNLLWD